MKDPGQYLGMPELPDVAGFADVARQHASRHRVREVVVTDASVVRGTSARHFARTVTGATVGTPQRHGKWLFVPVRPGRLIAVHFGMTGSFEWAAPAQERHRHDRVIFVLSGGELRYRDMRKLKGIRLIDRAGHERICAGLGPDATQITQEQFTAALQRSRRQVKPALTDQSLIAGLGNLLADEILWRARLDPRRRTDTLTDAEVRRLRARMRSTLRSAIPAARVPGHRSWLTGHRDDRPGSCPRCGAELERSRIGGRSTVSCPNCQPRS